jgi:serine/threonine-protein kinase
MNPESFDNLIDALSRNRLLEPEQIEEAQRTLRPRCENTRDLVQELIVRGWLSGYQGEQVLQGRADDLLLGPYRLHELLGEGNMGQVFKAWHLRLNRVVALKLIRPDRLSQDAEAVRRFQREARAAAQLLHPNVVIIYDADQVGDRHFIAMEYVDGIDLSRLVKQRGPLPQAEACEYIRQAAEGLQHAHEQGLVHRDIKPSNLLVTRAVTRSSGFFPRPVLTAASAGAQVPPPSLGVVKILDMGLARLVSYPGERRGDGSLTEEGQMMGTPDYIAPEQARNAHGVDIRADLYSLGCTLYYLLTGQPPFPEGSTIEKLLMHQLNEPRPLAELRSDVSPEVIALVKKLMAKKPSDRYQTPAEVAEALTTLAVSALAPAPPRLVPSAAAPEPSTNNSLALTEVAPLPPPSPPSRSEKRPPPSSPRADRIAVLKGHAGCVTAVAIAPNHKVMASGGVDGTVRIWDLTAKPPREKDLVQPRLGEVHSLLFSPDNHMLVGAFAGAVLVWDLTAEQPREKVAISGQQRPRALAFTRGSRLLAIGGDQAVGIWDVSGEGARRRVLLKGHASNVTAIAFSPEDTRLASGSEDGNVILWDTNRLWSKQQAFLRPHLHQVNSVTYSSDGTTLATAGIDQLVLLWDLTTGKPVIRAELEDHQSVVRQLLFTPDGKTLVSVDDGIRVLQWDLTTAKKLYEWHLPKMVALSYDCTQDGRFLATGNNDGSIYIFRLRIPAPNEAGSSEG